MSTRRSLRLALAACAAIALLLIAACGGDDDSKGDATTTAADTTATTEKTGPTVTVPRNEDLRRRLPDFAGYEREELENTFDQKRCDGEKFSTNPVSQANARYTRPDNQPGMLLYVGLAFNTPAEASKFYDELVISASDCVGEGQKVGKPEAQEVGDEAQLYPIETKGQPAGGILVARKGNEVWFLSSDMPGVGEVLPLEVLSALKVAVQG